MLRNLIQQKPHIPLAVTCLVIGLIAWLRKDVLVDVQYYDTYYLIPVYLLAELCAVIMLISSALYMVTQKRRGFTQLTTIHVLGTICIAIYLTATMDPSASAPAESELPMSIGEYRKIHDMSLRLLMALTILAVLQLLLIINIAIRLVRRQVIS